MIKSQDDLNPCNDGKRSSDVLLSTIEELERTKKQLKIAIDCLLMINCTKDFEHSDSMRIAHALHKIEELEQ